MGAAASERIRPSLSRVLRRAGFDIYDSLWACAGLSLFFWLGPYLMLTVLVARERLSAGVAAGLMLVGLGVFSFALAALLAHARAVVCGCKVGI